MFFPFLAMVKVLHRENEGKSKLFEKEKLCVLLFLLEINLNSRNSPIQSTLATSWWFLPCMIQAGAFIFFRIGGTTMKIEGKLGSAFDHIWLCLLMSVVAPCTSSWSERTAGINNWCLRSFKTPCTSLFYSFLTCFVFHSFKANNQPLIGAANFNFNNHKKCSQAPHKSHHPALHFLLTTKNLINFYAIFTISFPPSAAALFHPQ